MVGGHKRQIKLRSKFVSSLFVRTSLGTFYTGFFKLANFRFMKRSWIFDLEVSCKLFTFFFFANIGVSAQSMALVAVNRFVGVCFPDHAEKFNVKRARIMVTIIWYESQNCSYLNYM